MTAASASARTRSVKSLFAIQFRILFMPESVLRVENLIKRYGDVEAVRGVSFSVSEGEVFGLLGPNGAGKTSTIEILEGLRNADGGTESNEKEAIMGTQTPRKLPDR